MKRNKYLLNLMIYTIILYSPFFKLKAEQIEPKWEGFIDIEGKVGSKRNLREADIFIPILQNNHTLLYSDIRYRLDNQNSREGNFGLGLRHILPNDYIIGGYTYYDRRITPYNNYFSQITVGLETLSIDWDFRTNIYIPTGKKSHLEESLSSVDFTGTEIMYAQGEERSMKGYDAEIGYRLPIFSQNEDQQIRLYAGGFRFYENDMQSIQGPRGRIDLTLDEVPFLWKGSKLTLGAEIQRDNVRGRQSFTSLRIRIPFGTRNSASPIKTLSAIEKRMTTPIIRDVDIISQAGQFTKPEVVKADGSGNSLSLINADSTTGTDLKSIIENAGKNSTIVLSGEFKNINSTTTLKDGQSIIGKGNIEITTPAGQKVVIPVPGATIEGKGGYISVGTNTYFLMGNNTSLIGITAHNTDNSSHGTSIAHIKNVSNVTIKNNNFSVTSTANTAYIFTVDSSSDIYIGNNTLNMHNNGTFSSLIGFIQNTGSSLNNITFENNAYTVTGSANKSRTFFFNGVTINNLNGSNNTSNLTAGSMGTYNNASTINGSISFTNGFTTH